MKIYQYIHELAECRDVALVGGKGANLGALVRAGFEVPSGFVVDTRGFARAQEAMGDRPGAGSGLQVPREIPPDVVAEILEAYKALGGGAVAVRSSATAEDMAAASMAGQYETFLDVVGEELLLEKVRHCWASLDSPRIRAYLREHGIDQSKVAMGVVVQKLVPSDVAGVLFTMNPNGGKNAKKEMLIEASWGLGESVVGGRVQPDVLRVDSETGKVIEAVIADKRVVLAAGAHEERAVEESRRREACLKEGDVKGLWELGRRASGHFGVPQDIEWAIYAGKLYLLQSRPITTHLEVEAEEEVLRGIKEMLRARMRGANSGMLSGHSVLGSGNEGLPAPLSMAHSGVGQVKGYVHGPWALHNLAETLAHPTPLTWSVIARFMSGAGGFGAMYREAGFEPSAAVMKEGFLELIGGRIYMDAARAPEMFFEGFPFAYDLAELKRSPDASQLPPTVAKGSLKERMRVGKKLAAVQEKLKALSEEYDRTLREVSFKEMAEYAETEKRVKLEGLTHEALIEKWEERERRVMDEFGPKSLMPSLICGMALGELKAFLEEHLWDEDPDALAQMLSAGGLANRTVMADAELYEVGKGDRTLDSWLAEHGHRAAGEFDLAAPRWREQPEAIEEMAKRMVSGERPMERHRQTAEEVNRKIAAIHGRLARGMVAEFDRKMDLVRRYMPFREDGKDYLMLGYDLLRDVALEMGRRLRVGSEVFYLTREEVIGEVRSQKSEDRSQKIEERKRVYRVEGRLKLAHVIDGGGIEKLGEVEAGAEAKGGVKAFKLSAGVARGKVRVLKSPTEAGVLEKGYILVCPSTDPSWTPLFVNAAGLILECGGTLSHGAVVAREMGLPAVVVADATTIYKDGEEIIVDGTRGWVGRPSDLAQESAVAERVDPDDTKVGYKLVPPPAGAKDRRAGKLRNVFAAVWGVYLLAFFLLPVAMVERPTMGIMDALLWPIVRLVGKPGTVVVVACLIAVVTLLLQKFLTDNARLLEAKRRAGVLSKEADSLPADCARRKALVALAAPVQLRTLMAALVPVGILLGPMVMPFMWFKDRMDPASWSAPQGSTVTVVAHVDADWREPVKLEVSPMVELDETTAGSQSVPEVRKTLERLLTLYKDAATTGGGATKPWELAAGPDMKPEAAAADLEAYLKKGIPAQPLRWVLRPEADVTKFQVKVSTGKFGPVPVEIVLGDAFAPGVKNVAGNGGPVKTIDVQYPPAKVEGVFWRPLAFMGGKMGAWDAGWVWLYILAYLPVLFLVRWGLRVA